MTLNSVALADTTIDIKNAKQNSPALVEALAKFGAPESYTLDAKQDLREVVLQKCGGLDPTYLVLLIAENPQLSGWTAGKLFDKPLTLNLPACAKLPKSAEVTVQKGYSLSRTKQIYGINFPLDPSRAPSSLSGSQSEKLLVQKTPAGGAAIASTRTKLSSIELSNNIAAALTETLSQFTSPEETGITVSDVGGNDQLTGIELASAEWKKITNKNYE